MKMLFKALAFVYEIDSSQCFAAFALRTLAWVVTILAPLVIAVRLGFQGQLERKQAALRRLGVEMSTEDIRILSPQVIVGDNNKVYIRVN